MFLRFAYFNMLSYVKLSGAQVRKLNEKTEVFSGFCPQTRKSVFAY